MGIGKIALGVAGGIGIVIVVLWIIIRLTLDQVWSNF